MRPTRAGIREAANAAWRSLVKLGGGECKPRGTATGKRAPARPAPRIRGSAPVALHPVPPAPVVPPVTGDPLAVTPVDRHPASRHPGVAVPVVAPVTPNPNEARTGRHVDHLDPLWWRPDRDVDPARRRTAGHEQRERQHT